MPPKKPVVVCMGCDREHSSEETRIESLEEAEGRHSMCSLDRLDEGKTASQGSNRRATGGTERREKAAGGTPSEADAGGGQAGYEWRHRECA